MSINNIPPELLQMISGYNHPHYKWIVNANGIKLFQNFDDALKHAKTVFDETRELIINILFIDGTGNANDCITFIQGKCRQFPTNTAFDTPEIKQKLIDIGVVSPEILAHSSLNSSVTPADVINNTMYASDWTTIDWAALYQITFGIDADRNYIENDTTTQT